MACLKYSLIAEVPPDKHALLSQIALNELLDPLEVSGEVRFLRYRHGYKFSSFWLRLTLECIQANVSLHDARGFEDVVGCILHLAHIATELDVVSLQLVKVKESAHVQQKVYFALHWVFAVKMRGKSVDLFDDILL